MNEQYKKIIRISIWIGIVIFGIVCLVNLNNIIRDFSIKIMCEYASQAVSFTLIFIVFYEKWLWKYDPLCKVPVLKKKYEGNFFSSFDNKQRKMKLEIKQTLLSTHIIMKTKESKSSSINASIDTLLNEKFLIYTYMNMPDVKYRDESEIHYGTAVLCVEDVCEIQGFYYTDRQTRGDMTLTACK